MSSVESKRKLLESIDILVRKPSATSMQDLTNVFFGLGDILSDSFGEPVKVTTVFSGRIPHYPADFGAFSKEQLETERQAFVEFLKLQPHVLNVGYNGETKRFLLEEDQAAWEAWQYRALMTQVKTTPKINAPITDELKPEDLRVETYRPQGDRLNRVDRGVRVTHLPTGIVEESHEGRSQHENRAVAYEKLKARFKTIRGVVDE